MRPAGPVPLTALRSTPWAAATRAATGVTLAPSGIRAVPPSPAGRGAAVGSGAGVAAAFGAPAPAVMRARTWPTVTVSPASARISVIVPLAGEGTSASTLSVEISTIVSSTSTLSPAALAHSRIVPSDTDSPIWGIVMSRVCASPSGSPAASAAGVSSAAAAGALPLVGAISARMAPTSTVSPSAKWIFTTVPDVGAGTSASTLSVEISTRVSSSSIVSPSCLCHSRMVPSETDSPIAGMATSTVVLTAMSRSDHTAFERHFLPAYAVFVVDESGAACERAEAADHHHRHREPERHDTPPHGGDAQQRDHDPADAVRPAEVELRGRTENR